MTDKQLRFATEWLRDCNATNAAIRAGYTENRRSAATIGARLLKNVEIKAFIKQQTEIYVRDSIAHAAEVSVFLSDAMRNPAAPWAAHMVAANSLAKRQLLDAPRELPPLIIDDIVLNGEPTDPDNVVFRINGKPVKIERMFACLDLDRLVADN